MRPPGVGSRLLARVHRCCLWRRLLLHARVHRCRPSTPQRIVLHPWILLHARVHRRCLLVRRRLQGALRPGARQALGPREATILERVLRCGCACSMAAELQTKQPGAPGSTCFRTRVTPLQLCFSLAAVISPLQLEQKAGSSHPVVLGQTQAQAPTAGWEAL